MNTENWESYVKKNLFSFKDDFYELPYLSNSPEIQIKSFVNPSEITYKPLEPIAISDSSYYKGEIQYAELDKGLWIMSTQVHVKKNIIAKALSNSNENSDAYYLTISCFEYTFPTPAVNYPAKILSKCWTFHKPRTEVNSYFYKNTEGHFLTIAFTKKWMEAAFSKKETIENKEILKFIDSKTGFLNWINTTPELESKATEIAAIFKEKDYLAIDINKLKDTVSKYTFLFFKMAFREKRIQNYKRLKNSDYGLIAKAEKIVLEGLSFPFVGIETLAKKTGFSPTKLKTTFKSVFGMSVLQYHKEKNLQLAHELLCKTEIQIKLIANLTGGLDSSKFSEAYKLKYRKKPSDERRL